MKDLISVIVPIYNVEKYIARCLNSILLQTYTNLQIILINDGSTDKSAEICNEYIKKDSRIEYIYQENAGLACARNKGLEHVRGEYIVFIDSDDYVAYDYVEKLHCWITDYRADVAVCDIIRTVNDCMDKHEIKDLIVKKSDGKNFIRKMYDCNIDVIEPSCNKMFKSEIFVKERFPNGKLFEDFVLMTKILYNANLVVYGNAELYYYFQAPNSITRMRFTEKHLNRITEYEKILCFFRDMDERQLYNRALQGYEVIILKSYYLSKRDLSDSEQILCDLMKKYRRYLFQTIKTKETILLKKIFLLMGGSFPYMMGFVINNILKIQ